MMDWGQNNLEFMRCLIPSLTACELLLTQFQR
jgi:hypothetical protein